MAVFITAWSAHGTAEAYLCAAANATPRPDWVAQFGNNGAQTHVFGYAQTRPRMAQSLDALHATLKSQALADLALNIKSNVTSEVSTTQLFLGDNAQSRTEIVGRASSILSLNLLDGTRTYIDETKCIAYARVQLSRDDLPFVLALSEVERFERQLNVRLAPLEDIARLPVLLANLQQAADIASVPTAKHYAALEPQLGQLRFKAREQEIGLRFEKFETPNTPARKKLAEAAAILALIAEQNRTNQKMSKQTAAIQHQLTKRTAEIESVLGSDKTIVGWTTLGPAADGILHETVAQTGKPYWHPALRTMSETAKTGKNYELKRALWIAIKPTWARRFGIDEVTIAMTLTYFDPETGRVLEEKPLKVKAVGRPIDDAKIADKIAETVKAHL